VLIRQGTLPKTSSGKTQRRLCRELYLAGRLDVLGQWHAADEATDELLRREPSHLEAERRPYVAPRTETERLLAAAWAEVLGVQRVGIHDDFFELGGNSLLAAQLLSRLTAATGIEIPLGSLFDRTTVAGLAEIIDQAKAASGEDTELSEILTRIEAMSEQEVARLLSGGTNSGSLADR
jgi:acyl carrier protein